MIKFKTVLPLVLILIAQLQSIAQIYPCKTGNAWGYCDAENNIVIKPVYEDADIFLFNVARVKSQNKWGVIDSLNNIIIPIEFDKIEINFNGLITVQKQLKTGVYDTKGNLILPVIYNRFEFYSNHILTSQKKDESSYWNDKKGLFTLTGKEVLPAIYDEITVRANFEGSNEMIINSEVNSKEEYWFADTLTWQIYKPAFRRLEALNRNGYFKGSLYVLNGNTESKYALIKGRRQCTEPLYDDIVFFNSELVHVKLNRYWGMIDTTGKEILPAKFEEISYESEGLILVKMDKKYFFINRNGERSIAVKYDDAEDFSNGYAKVGKNIYIGNRPLLHFGMIDKYGREIIAIKYAEVRPAYKETKGNGKLFTVRDSSTGLYGVIDTLGNQVIPFKYKMLSYFDSQGRAIASVDTLVDNKRAEYKGMIKIDGKILVPFKYNNSIEEFKNGRARVKNYFPPNEYCGIIDTLGNEIVSPKYSEIREFKSGYAIVKMGLHTYKYGTIDSTGKEIIPVLYSSVGEFHDGLARVSLKTDSTGKIIKHGFIDTKGRVIIEPQYDEVPYDFKNGITVVILNKKCGVINTKGKVIVPVKYASCYNNNEYILAWTESKLYSLFDNSGKVILADCVKIEKRHGYYYYDTGTTKGKLNYTEQK